MYFWSFIVALLLFSGGGVFSVYEGVHKLQEPEPIEHVGVAVGILLFSLALEGWATWGNLKEMKERRGATPLLRYLRETKDSDLVVIFGENSAAVTGLILALASLGLAWKTGNPAFDAIGSIGIGVVLIGVAVFLGVEIHSLLLGERADPSVEATARAVAVGMDGIEEVLTVLTVQQGPGEVLLAMKLRLREGMTTTQVVDSINRYEEKLKAAVPTVRWCFVEPDHVA
jgi:divalent metal cation (Fe/Co/Zn/Cd) transporter